MEEINFREVFRENCYIPALRNLVETFSAQLCRNMERATEAFLSPLEAFLNLLLDHRDRGSIPAAGRLCLSFLRTSLRQGKPVLLAEAYENLPFLEKPVMSCELSGEWMLPGWNAFREELDENLRRQSLGRYVRSPERRSYEEEAVSILLRQLAMAMKYMLWGLEYRGIWKRLSALEGFSISYGEYMDWQFPLLEIKGDVDIFLCDDRTDLTFRRFQGLHYEDKQFGPRELDDCVFRECTFQKADFVETKLRNTRFIRCVFEDCRFAGAELMGSSFMSGRLRGVCFKQCGLMPRAPYYAPASFKWSLLEAVDWPETEIRDDMFVDCQRFDA